MQEVSLRGFWRQCGKITSEFTHDSSRYGLRLDIHQPKHFLPVQSHYLSVPYFIGMIRESRPQRADLVIVGWLTSISSY